MSSHAKEKSQIIYHRGDTKLLLRLVVLHPPPGYIRGERIIKKKEIIRISLESLVGML